MSRTSGRSNLGHVPVFIVSELGNPVVIGGMGKEPSDTVIFAPIIEVACDPDPPDSVKS